MSKHVVFKLFSVHVYCTIVTIIYLFREFFVSTDDAGTLRTFMRAARNSHVDLRCAKVSDSLWGLYNLQLTESYARSPNYSVKTLVTSIGRQHGTKVWVFGPTVQIDQNGRAVPYNQQKFYW